MDAVIAIGLIGGGLYLLLNKKPAGPVAVAYPYVDWRDSIVELGDVE